MIKILFHNIHDDTRYAFAVAKIRALESRMLDTSLTTRMLKANGTDDMLKILMDTAYNVSLNEAGDSPFESVIEKELHRIYILIRSIDPDPEWTDLWRWRYDAHNIKVILKTGSSNEHALEHLISYGILDPPKLLQDIQEGDYSSLPQPFKEAVEKILSDADEKKAENAQEIDFIIDRALYLFFSQETKRSKNIFMMDLVAMMIDFINLRSFLRIKDLKIPVDLFRRSFIPGGRITEDPFLPQDEKSSHEIVMDIIQTTPYIDLKPYLDSKNLAVIEAGMDNYIIAYLRQTRQRAFGVEPLIGYMIAKELEIKNLRIIYVGKVNALEEGLITERLRETYVQ